MASSHFASSVHHCEAVCDDAHGGNAGFRKCTLNPGHTNSLAVEEFTMEKLPAGFRTENNANYIENIVERTVKITLSLTSENRPDTYPGCPMPYPFSDRKGNSIIRCGTGFIDDTLPKFKKGSCPCPHCKKSDQPKTRYWEFTVATATHVVFDDVEAESVVVELFYDKEDKRGVQNLYGVHTKGTSHDRFQTDACDVVCITHDAHLMNRLKSIDVLFHRWKLGIVVSHPHGAPKRISLGQFYHRRFVTDPDTHSIKLEKGTRVYFHSAIKDNLLENVQNYDPECDGNSNNNSDNEITRSPINDEEKTKAVESKDIETSQPECDNFYRILRPTDMADVFELTAGMDVLPPPNQGIVSDLAKSKFSQRGCTFPAGTEFKTSDGTIIDVPMGTEFNVLPSDSCYITYDMPTCPGSSGAAVLLDYPFVGRWRHFGCSVGCSKNRSGLLHGWLTGRKYYHDYDALALDDGADGDDDDEYDEDDSEDSDDDDDDNEVDDEVSEEGEITMNF